MLIPSTFCKFFQNQTIVCVLEREEIEREGENVKGGGGNVKGEGRREKVGRGEVKWRGRGEEEGG